jgi:hypothetical protein
MYICIYVYVHVHMYISWKLVVGPQAKEFSDETGFFKIRVSKNKARISLNRQVKHSFISQKNKL